MEIIKKLVLLLKVSTDLTEHSDKYELLLRNNGYETVLIPVLDFEYVNINELNTKLINSNNYSGLIFTSPRAVRAVKNTTIHLSEWNSLSNYVVGESTGELVETELHLNCKGKESGNADKLADFMIEDNNVLHFSQPFLFPCGNLKGDTLMTKLSKVNIHVESINVYNTVPNSNLKDLLIKVTEYGQKIPEFIVFFSPSGVKYTIPVLNQLNIDTAVIKCIAIGPSTEKAMIENDLEVYSVCEKPSSEALVKAINKS